MRLLVIDSSSDTGDQRSPGVLPPDAFQPFLRRCRLLGQFDDVANRIIIDIHRLTAPAVHRRGRESACADEPLGRGVEMLA